MVDIIDIEQAAQETAVEGAHVKTATVEKQQSEGEINPDPEAWYLTSEMKGIGPRPEYILPKFGNMAEQAKAYPALQSKMGGFTGAPEEYDFSNISKEFNVEFDFDNQESPASQFRTMCRQNNVSQQFASQMMTLYSQDFNNNQPPNAEDIVKTLGSNYENVINRAGTYLSNAMEGNEFTELSSMIKDLRPIPIAKFLQTVDSIRKYNKAAANPPHPSQGAGVPKRTSDQIQAEMTILAKSIKDPEILNERMRPLREELIDLD